MCIDEESLWNDTTIVTPTNQVCQYLYDQYQILVNEEEGQLTLVTGQRRVEACKKAGKQVWWVSQRSAQGMLNMSTPLQLRRMELMENLSRCSFTPVEEAKAIAEIER